jgi:hypothetical protein
VLLCHSSYKGLGSGYQQHPPPAVQLLPREHLLHRYFIAPSSKQAEQEGWRQPPQQSPELLPRLLEVPQHRPEHHLVF